VTATLNSLTLTIPVEGGRLKPSPGQQATIGNYLGTREGKAVEVKFARPTTSRSLRQNRYYWGAVIGAIAESTGNSPEDLHLVLKDMFLPRKFITLGAKEVEVRKTSADLSTEEFADYLRRIEAWAATELGIAIPTNE
jgi:hypothetical protein